MRRSIRAQILIPIILIQAVTVGAITLATATLAARRAERQVVDRLAGVVESLGRANFPYTPGVLALMRGLSGAEFVAYAADGRPSASSVPGSRGRLPSLGTLPAEATRLDAIGEAPTVRLGEGSYLAVLLPASGRGGAESLLVLYPESSWRQARREAASPPLLLGGGALAVMAAVSGWVAHRIGGRIRRVERQVARIAAGEFEGLDPGRQRDEVADLVRSINAMCLQLSEMSQTIRRSERARLLAQLAAGLAHQLRNALTGARMSIQLHLKRHPAPPGDRSLEIALHQLTITEEQVRGLLSLGRVEQRAAGPCDLGAILRDVALLVGPAGEHAKVAVSLQDGLGPLPVVADEAGLRAAALNLALNAIEAAGPGGKVRLEAGREGDEAVLEVGDTGPGPPPELAGTLFEPFVSGKPEGVGLGLALAHQVASRHGGSLSWGRERDETRFRLAIPLAGPAGKETR
ncbi:sensor histidine kinase [Tautonia sociabilis]|uniref:histidine kinase n=1 Tax=Tautonia sociabilis TaxID=2080755 RepID=A0A432MG31_9BACT|nr:HAMP domain-containing sensor histidine kinase [Tautonia sociabilis]RUL85369.1 HAMP domain-containing histidine kinase [Tautonia sociabilis]